MASDEMEKYKADVDRCARYMSARKSVPRALEAIEEPWRTDFKRAFRG
jgi:hypothetical protein